MTNWQISWIDHRSIGHAVEVLRRASSEYNSGPEESEDEFYGYSDDEFPDDSHSEDDEFPYHEFQEDYQSVDYDFQEEEEERENIMLETFKLFFERLEKTEPQMTCFLYYRDNHCIECDAYTGPEENRYPNSCHYCKKPLTDHEGYTMEYDDIILCNLCAEIIQEDESEREKLKGNGKDESCPAYWGHSCCIVQEEKNNAPAPSASAWFSGRFAPLLAPS